MPTAPIASDPTVSYSAIAPRHHVAVCICTFDRVPDLARLLGRLQSLRFERIPEPELTVIVVENDRRALAADLVRSFSSRFPIRYAVEPTPGISHARNACLDRVPGSADIVAFLDDDEWPAPEWLEALLIAFEDHDADVVNGPVVPEYEEAPSPLIERAGFFARREHATGTLLSECNAGNVALRMELVRQVNARFDERLSTSGGEDVLLFSWLARQGARLVWCNEAVVHEKVPPARLCCMYHMRRAYRIGTTEARVHRYLQRRYTAPKFLLLGLCRTIGHAGLSVLHFPFGPHRSLLSLRRTAVGFGNIAGALGGTYEEYARLEH